MSTTVYVTKHRKRLSHTFETQEAADAFLLECRRNGVKADMEGTNYRCRVDGATGVILAQWTGSIHDPQVLTDDSYTITWRGRVYCMGSSTRSAEEARQRALACYGSLAHNELVAA